MDIKLIVSNGNVSRIFNDHWEMIQFFGEEETSYIMNDEHSQYSLSYMRIS